MTAEGATGAPLRQQIAEAIHDHDCEDNDLVNFAACFYRTGHEAAADAVVALLNLTEEEALLDTRDDEYLIYTGYGPEMTRRMAQRDGCALATRYVTPWLPTTPPDTSSSEPS